MSHAVTSISVVINGLLPRNCSPFGGCHRRRTGGLPRRNSTKRSSASVMPYNADDQKDTQPRSAGSMSHDETSADPSERTPLRRARLGSRTNRRAISLAPNPGHIQPASGRCERFFFERNIPTVADECQTILKNVLLKSASSNLEVDRKIAQISYKYGIKILIHTRSSAAVEHNEPHIEPFSHRSSKTERGRFGPP